MTHGGHTATVKHCKEYLEPAWFSDSTRSTDQARAARSVSRIRVPSDGVGHRGTILVLRISSNDISRKGDWNCFEFDFDFDKTVIQH